LVLLLDCFLYLLPSSPLVALSLHDALPIFFRSAAFENRREKSGDTGISGPGTGKNSFRDITTLENLPAAPQCGIHLQIGAERFQDRKSTRLNSSHVSISYAVFCLKKKKQRG